jgi:hypothetical protein
MGIEYHLRFAAPDPSAVADVLRRHPAAREVKPPGLQFEFGSADDGWPEATAHAEADGAYFCDHCGGTGRALLDEVVARLVSEFGAVTIEEL